MGGIVVKYFPDCYNFDEGELNRILSVAFLMSFISSGLPDTDHRDDDADHRHYNTNKLSKCTHFGKRRWLEMPFTAGIVALLFSIISFVPFLLFP